MELSYFCVFLAFVLIYIAKVPVGYAQYRAGGYDNRDPRGQQARLEGWARRALAAHLNSLEAFPPFAAAVIVAHLRNVDPALIAKLSVAFVALRVCYLVLYWANVHALRSIVWFAGILCVAALFLVS